MCFGVFDLSGPLLPDAMLKKITPEDLKQSQNISVENEINIEML